MSWILYIIAALLIWLWWDGLGAKEIARRKGKQLCRDADLQFLDDTVMQSKLRVCFYQQKKLGIYRRFIFEFSSDGETRYEGYVDMFGHHVIASEMQPYRIP